MLLEMKDIVKRYGSLVANNHVSLSLDKGEILAVVGENGAGKSTIMKVLYGLEKPDSGEILINGQRQNITNPSDAMKKGIGMVQQHFMLFEPLTVAENIVYQREITKGIFLDKNQTRSVINGLSERYMLKVDPDAKVEDCPLGLRQRVEILKILYQNADIIIFDEPSAVLTPLEVTELLKTMKRLAEMGKSLILITHKLSEVMEVADRVVVMRAGEVVYETKKEDTSIDELSYYMVGRQIPNQEFEVQQTGEILLEVKDLVTKSEQKNAVDGVNLHVNAGEIVGIAGVAGNGQSELIQCITGLRHTDAGSVVLEGKDVTNHSAKDISTSGLAHIPEDRYIWGSASGANLMDNSLIGREAEEPFAKKGILNWGQIREHAQHLINEYNVKASSLKQKISELSGGNAQKLIVAREISRDTPVLICCEPTRGVDIGASEFIHNQILEKRKRGDGVLLVSSELSEIMKLCDRIYVMFDGKINGEFSRENFDDKKLGLLMLGGALDEA